MNERPRVGPDKVGPEDPRYADLVRRGFNKRFAGKPDYVRLVGSTAQVVDAVQDAVREKLRVVVRSGGHCLEGFVADPAVRVVMGWRRIISTASGWSWWTRPGPRGAW